MSQNPESLCRRHGLTYVERSALNLRRRPCGRGFVYLDASAQPVRDKALKARIKALAIPPAWADVCIAEDENAHIQAIGRDAGGLALGVPSVALTLDLRPGGTSGARP